jgi:hypothetical protein
MYFPQFSYNPQHDTLGMFHNIKYSRMWPLMIAAAQSSETSAPIYRSTVSSWPAKHSATRLEVSHSGR